MKKGVFYSTIFTILVILFFSSCSKFKLYSEGMTYHYGILSDVNNMMTDNPDIALEMLENFTDSNHLNKLSEVEFYEYNILLAEARYKCNLSHINKDELEASIHYFDSLKSIYKNDTDILFLNAKSHYYYGVWFEEDEKYKEAFVNYISALELIELIGKYRTTQDIEHYKALSYVRLSDILYWLDSYEQAIECLNNANLIFAEEKKYEAIVRNNIVISIMYGQNYDYNNAFKYTTLADSILSEHIGNSGLKYEIERINASIMYNLGYHEESFATMKRQYNTLKSNQKMEAAGVLGDMYYSKGILDSAIYYYEQYFPDNRFSKIDAANHIIEISLKTGNQQLITEYAPILAEETNKELMLSTIKTEISSLYEQYKINKYNNFTYKRILTYLGVLLTMTLLFFVIGMYLLRLKKIKYNKEINEKRYYINSLQEKIDKKSSENKYIRQRIVNLESELQDIKTKKYLMHAPFDMKLKQMLEEIPICKRLVEIAQNTSIKTNTQYPEYLLSEKEQGELIALFNKNFNNVFNKIISEHKGLRTDDNLYFCLYLIGMDEKHISAVTGRTYNIIYNRTKKIQLILGSNDNIKNILRNMI